MTHQKQILIITRNLPPLVGGMEKLNFHMATELSKTFDVTVIGPKQAAIELPPNIHFIGVPLKPLWLFLTVAMLRSLIASFRIRPDIILAGSGLTAPMAYISALLSNSQSAVYTHGLDVTVKSKIYTRFWLPCIKRADKIIANSNYTAQLLQTKGVENKKISIVYPGVEMPSVPDDKGKAFKTKYQLHDGPILLSVGRLTTRKGLLEFVKFSLPKIVKKIPNVQLVVIGEEPANSLAAKNQTRKEIKDAANALNIGSNIKFIGVITDPEKLTEAYYAASTHVFPVREIPNDPEGFGMVSIEAAAHGVQTVAFSTGGIIDAVSHEKSGYLVEKNNYSKLSEFIIKSLLEPIDSKKIQDFALEFTWDKFGIKIFGELESSLKQEI